MARLGLEYAPPPNPSHPIRPAPSRGSTGLAGGFTRPAGLPHPWGATSCRKAAPFTYPSQTISYPRLYPAPDYIIPLAHPPRARTTASSLTRPQKAASRALLSHPRVNQPRAFWVVIFTGKLGFIAGSSCNVVWCWVGAGGLHTQQQTAARFQSSTSRNKPPVVPPFLVTVIGVDSPRETPPHQASASPVVLL